MEDDLMDEPSAEPRPKPAFGQLSNRPRTALDSRSAFFRDKESYLLYFWEVLDKNNLMVSSMQRLDNRVAATNGADGIPSVIGKKRKPDDSSVTTGGGVMVTATTGRQPKKLRSYQRRLVNMVQKCWLLQK